MTYIIKDLNSGQYYVRQPSKLGWYHPNIERARLYTDYVYAENTIRKGGHHIDWPGHRDLKVIKVTITEDLNHVVT